MIKLFDSSEKSFTTNGICFLNEATKCEVDEELNGQFELSLSYPADEKWAKYLTHNSIIFCKPNPYDDPEPFRIYSVEKNMGRSINVSARHVSYQLSFIPVLPHVSEKLTSALDALTYEAIENVPFIFTSDFDCEGALYVDSPRSIRSVLGEGEDSIISVYGGELEFSRFTVRLLKHRGENRGVTFWYGKDLLDFTQEMTIANTVTSIFPYYLKEESITVEGQNYRVLVSVYLSEKVLRSSNSSNFPFPRTVPVDLTSEFPDHAPTEDQLRRKAMAYMDAHKIGVPEVSLTVKYADLRKTEEYKAHPITQPVKLGDTVSVVFKDLNVTSSGRITGTKYDAINDTYISVNIGDEQHTLAGTINSNAITAKNAAKNVSKQVANANHAAYVRNQQTIKLVEEEIKQTSAAIRGANGGYILLNVGSDNQPFELLALDNPDVTKAKHVIRLNKKGLAFSKTGYDGNFTAAITIDGTIDGTKANIINLDAGSIKTGVIKDHYGNTTIDLDNGGISTKVLILDSDRLKIKENGTIRTTRKGGGMDNFDSFLEIAGAYLQMGVLSHSEGGSAPDDYNENYFTAGATDGTETDGKKNSAFNLQSHGITFDIDYIDVTKNRRYIGATQTSGDQTLPLRGQSGSIVVNGITLTFVNGIMVSGLS